MGRLTFLTVLLVALAPCATAGAASISYELLRSSPGTSGDRYGPGLPPTETYVLRVTGEGADRDVVTVEGSQAGPRVRTAGTAAPRLGEGCGRDADGWVVCTPPDRPGHATEWELRLATGTGDDVVRGDAAGRAEIDLGDGDDAAELRDTFGRVTGGPGRDSLWATSGSAAGRASAGIATDTVDAGVTWDGGPGGDRAGGEVVLVTYADRTAPVNVTPDGVADDGEAGEGDDIGADVAVVQGGAGPDTLTSAGWVVHGGAGDDVLTGFDGERQGRPTTGPQEVLLGGAGDDVLLGRGGREELSAGPGNDRTDGGAGDDQITDGDGADRVAGGDGDDRVELPPDGRPDRLAGGEGRDRLWSTEVLASRAVFVTISLDGRANDGTLGEGDDAGTDFEEVSADRGRLIGSDRGETLELQVVGQIDGRGGDDVVVGGTVVDGGPGRDRLIDAGRNQTYRPADARIDVRDGERDEVTCPAGLSPRVLRRDREDRVRRCFGLARPLATLPSRPRRRGQTLTVIVRCSGHQPCRGRLTVTPLRERAKALGRAGFTLRPRSRKRVAVRLRHRYTCERVALQTSTRSPFTPGDVRQAVQYAGPGRSRY